MGTRSEARAADDGARAGPRVRTTVGGAVVLLLVAGAAAVLSFTLNASGGSRAVGNPGAAPAESAAAPSGTTRDSRILVHVLGAVTEPGLYELADGERLVDAVAAAGGFTAEADRAALNLARVVSDGEQVYVPVVGEEPPPAAEDPGGLVNLNTADAAELETLPGLGPELAARIVEWRTQNGRFSTVDD
ncbi:MAG: SLBB domain-containing protein, partial [Actinomycetota bacterium]|nr:SLBB domain-containing protein [Actinomycetota bacterium]